MKRNAVCALFTVFIIGFLFMGPARAQTMTWWVENASRKVMQDRAPQPNYEVSLEAARNEYEPFQVVLRADGGDLLNVSAQMSSLMGPGGALISYDNIKLYRGDYVNLPLASGQGGQGDGLPGDPRAPGEYVDPLIPFYDPYDPAHPAVGVPFNVASGRLQPIYGDIYIPPGTPPGDYSGLLRITAGGSTAQVPVKLHVWNFTLSNTRRVATAYGFSFGGVLQYHGGPDGAWDEEALAIMKTYEKTLHDFRIDLTNVIQGPPSLPSPFFQFDAEGKLIPPDYTAYDEQIGSRLEGTRFGDGISNAMTNNGLLAPGHGRSMTDDQYIQAAADFARHLKEKGWFNRIYAYVHDEPWLYQGAYERIAYDVALLKIADPDWVSRMMATNHWVRELQFSIGIWCPLTGNYDNWNWSQPEYGREDYLNLIAKGQKLWFYVCNGTIPPYAGYDIDTIWGHEPRILMWGSWYEGASGFLFWQTNFWYHSDPWGTLIDVNTFPWVARTGDGMLLYPGDHNGTAGVGVGSPAGISMDGPVISLRLMMTREGLEDWEYMLMAEDLGEKDFARAETETVYTQLGINPALYDPASPPWTQDDNKIYEARSQIGRFIEAAVNAPPIQAAVEDDGGGGGCSTSAGSGSDGALPAAMVLMFFAVGLIVIRRVRGRAVEPKGKIFKLFVLIAGCAIVLGIGIGCGGSSGGGDSSAGQVLLPTPPGPPPIYDHNFPNAQSAAGDIPADLNALGPKITTLAINPDTLTVQGQLLMFAVTFDDSDGDVAAPSLMIQIMGLDEHWVLGPDQFGGVIGNTATVQVDLSTEFEPGAYVLRVGMMDDAGHIGNVATSVIIVQGYSTPDVVFFIPGDGDTNVPLNTPIGGFFSDAVMGEPVTVTLTQNGQDIPGTTQMMGTMKGVSFVPDNFLLPGLEYAASITIGTKTITHHFTAEIPAPAPDVTGRVYSLIIAPDKIVEPVGAEILFWTITFPPILVKIKTFDESGGTVASIGATGVGDPLAQDPRMDILDFPGVGAVLDNPLFSLGHSYLYFDLYVLSNGVIDTSVNIYDFTVTGKFSTSGDSVDNVIITGYMDAAEINYAVNKFMPGGIPFNVCVNLPGACDLNNHIPFRAQYLTGAYQPQIGDFYGMTLEADPVTVSGAAGAAVTVSGVYTINGNPSGTHTVTLTTTAGTFPNSGMTYSLDTAGGAYSTTLTIPPGTGAQTVKLTATASSPIGDMPRRAKVTIQ